MARTKAQITVSIVSRHQGLTASAANLKKPPFFINIQKYSLKKIANIIQLLNNKRAI